MARSSLPQGAQHGRAYHPAGAGLLHESDHARGVGDRLTDHDVLRKRRAALPFSKGLQAADDGDMLQAPALVFTPQNLPWRPGYWPFLLLGFVTCLVGRTVALLSARARLALLGPWVWSALAAASTSGAVFMLSQIFSHPRKVEVQLVYASFGPPLFLMFIVLGTIILGAVGSFAISDEDRRRWISLSSDALILILGWTLINFSVLYFPTIFVGLLWQTKAWMMAAGAAATLITLLAGYSSKTAEDIKQILGSVAGIPFLKAVPELLTAVVLFLAPPVAALWLLLIASLASVRIAEYTTSILHGAQWAVFLLSGVVLALSGALLGRLVNVNKFSLNSMYRDRLIAVYLGASNPSRESRFTSFHRFDNLPMSNLPRRPLHVLNMSLPLKSRMRLTRASTPESFTVSPLHAGSPVLGYRPVHAYGGPTGITLGTAMAISGSSSSAIVGYSSSPVVRFVLNLFDARLGWPLGNPGRAGKTNWSRTAPKFAPAALWDDTLGHGTDSSPYVRLADGGHFDNLGIYQMVLRRCRVIIAVDASQDATYQFEELGAVLRRIQIDLGIPVEFPEGLPRPAEPSSQHYALGYIHYSVVDRVVPAGLLLYLKPICGKNEPVSISAYASSHPDFPHQIMEGQEFDEAQFEAYRLLGLHTIREVAGENPSSSIFEFVQKCMRESTAH